MNKQAQKFVYSIIILVLIIGFAAWVRGEINKQTVSNSEEAANQPIPNDPFGSESPEEFGSTITLFPKQSVTFPDGLIVTLDKISDSRCKPNVQCIWAGEIAGTFTIVGPTTRGLPEIQLGTTNNKSVTKNGYTFTIKNATPETISITVEKKPASKPVSVGNCYIGGCSGEICSGEEGVVSACRYEDRYACYKNARCERQANGECGWTGTPVLTQCLQNAPNGNAVY